MSGLIISLSGLPEKAVPGQVDSGVLDALSLAYCSVVAVLAILSALAFTRFPISRADHEERVRQLAAASLQKL